MSSLAQRRTKIVVTLGPSLNDRESLKQAIENGADVFRANFSHGKIETHEKVIQLIRDLAAEAGRIVAVLVDLQGPKIRIARFKNKKVQLREGQSFLLDTQMNEDEGTEEAVGLAYKDLPQDVRANDILLLDDGRMTFTVEKVEGSRIYCKVLVEDRKSTRLNSSHRP